MPVYFTSRVYYMHIKYTKYSHNLTTLNHGIILGNNQLDALFHVFIYFMSLHVSSVAALIIRRSNCINTSSGMIGLCK